MTNATRLATNSVSRGVRSMSDSPASADLLAPPIYLASALEANALSRLASRPECAREARAAASRPSACLLLDALRRRRAQSSRQAEHARKRRRASMKGYKLFVGLAAGAVGLWASAALADVYVQAYITKDKTLTVDETYDVHKFVNLFTWDWIPVDASSEQHIFKNQRNQFNFVQDEDAQASANITGSAATTTGIVLINQAPGFINNQGNEVSVTFAESPGNVGYRPQPSPTIDSTPLSF